MDLCSIFSHWLQFNVRWQLVANNLFKNNDDEDLKLLENQVCIEW